MKVIHIPSSSFQYWVGLNRFLVKDFFVFLKKNFIYVFQNITHLNKLAVFKIVFMKHIVINLPNLIVQI